MEIRDCSWRSFLRSWRWKTFLCFFESFGDHLLEVLLLSVFGVFLDVENDGTKSKSRLFIGFLCLSCNFATGNNK